MTSSTEFPASPLREVTWVFLKLGMIGFGGPAAHIALMEEEVVVKRRWISREGFLELVAASNFIPGPNSTELAIHLGRLRAGTPGLIVAGACFIVPAMLLALFCGWFYVGFGKLPETAAVLKGVKPVILAIVVLALWRFMHSVIQSRLLAGIVIAVGIANTLGVHELLLLGAAGLVMMMTVREKRAKREGPALMFGAVPQVGSIIASTAPQFGLWPMFGFFVKTGSVLFGSGYVLLAFLRADLVERWRWLSEAQLLDAIAVGQVTPGPVFTTATFIGYILAGVPGGLVATLGIFLPAFVFVAITAPILPKLRESKRGAAFLSGCNAASLALMAVVTWQLGDNALVDWRTIALAMVSLILLWKFRVNSAWLILAGAGLGLALR